MFDFFIQQRKRWKLFLYEERDFGKFYWYKKLVKFSRLYSIKYIGLVYEKMNNLKMIKNLIGPYNI